MDGRREEPRRLGFEQVACENRVMAELVVTMDGRRLEVLTGGAVGGFPLLFHSGTPSAAVPLRSMWQAAERAGLFLVTFSRPGYGASTPRQPETEARIVDDVEDSTAVLDALGIDEFVTLGWSGGGPRALGCAALWPGRCRAAVSLAGIAPDGQPDLDLTAGMGPENVRDFDLARGGRERLRPQAEQDAVGYAQVTGQEIAAGLGGLVDEVDAAALTGELAEDLAAIFRHAFSQGAVGYLEDNLQLVRPWGFDLGRIQVPVAVWQGAKDRMVPYAHGQWLASAIPGARARLFEAEGHISLVVRMDDILANLRDMATL